MTDFFENLLNNGELQEKVAELQAYKDVNEDFKTAWAELKAENDRLQKELEPFKDDYFKGLDNKTIAKLAKKSIRITSENRRLENCLQEIKAIAEEDVHIVGDEKIYYDSIEKILQVITKAEEE